jgi:hypothetical protein
MFAVHRPRALLAIVAASAAYGACSSGSNSGAPVACAPDAAPSNIDSLPSCFGWEGTACTPCDWCNCCGSDAGPVSQCSSDGTGTNVMNDCPYYGEACGGSSGTGPPSSSGGGQSCVWEPSVQSDGSATCPYGAVDPKGCCNPCPGFVMPSALSTCPDAYVLHFFGGYPFFCCPASDSNSDAGADAEDSDVSLDAPGGTGGDAASDAPEGSAHD